VNACRDPVNAAGFRRDPGVGLRTGLETPHELNGRSKLPRPRGGTRVALLSGMQARGLMLTEPGRMSLQEFERPPLDTGVVRVRVAGRGVVLGRQRRGVAA
jgi:hypothetical protein